MRTRTVRNVVSLAVWPLIGLSLILPTVSAQEFPFEFAYTSGRADGHVGIYLRSSSGETLLTAPFTRAEAPRWSPDGRQFVFQALVDDQTDIYVMDLKKNEHTRLTHGGHHNHQPVWSPTGTTIAFHSLRDGGGVWLIESDGSNLRRFPVEIRNQGGFSWSPDGRQVVFCANERVAIPGAPRPESLVELNTDLFIASGDGTKLRSLLRESNGSLLLPAWSPDGKKIAFVKQTNGKPAAFDICLVNIDGTGFTRLSSRPGQNLCPQWLPDNSGVLFHHTPHNTSATPQIIRVLADGTGESVVDVGPFGGYFPAPRRQLQ